MVYPDVQKLINVMNQIDNGPYSRIGFSMCSWWFTRRQTTHPCGTACCISGWATYQMILDGDLDPDKMPSGHEVNHLVKYCGIPDAIARSLALPTINYDKPVNRGLSSLTLEMAIRVLEILRDTGEVKWNDVYQEMKGTIADVI